MAYITTNTCFVCGITFQGVKSNECGACAQLRIDREKREHFGALDALTLEERIRKLEEWVYYYKPTYVPPPTY